jgi:hypothetical protein
MKTHQVKPGDCFTSIAFENGFFWQTLWDHPENEALREERGNPFTLIPGVDSVVVPDVRTREEACATERVHTFRRRGVPAKLKLRLLDHDGTPRAGAEYFLEVDGELRPNDKKADGEGKIEEFIPNNARKARLFLRGGEEIIEIDLGYLQPSSAVRGAQARLANVGFYRGALDGQRSPAFTDALERFRAWRELDAALTEEQLFLELEQAHEG